MSARPIVSTLTAAELPVSTINDNSACRPTFIPHWSNDKYRWYLSTQVAYYLAEKRGFSPGHELDDWLTAEAEVETLLEGRHYSGD